MLALDGYRRNDSLGYSLKHWFLFGTVYMSLSTTAFLISHLTLTNAFIWEYPSHMVASSSPNVGSRACPVAAEFIKSGVSQAQVPLSTQAKIGTMVLVEKEGKRYIIGLHGEQSHTKPE